MEKKLKVIAVINLDKKPPLRKADFKGGFYIYEKACQCTFDFKGETCGEEVEGNGGFLIT